MEKGSPSMEYTMDRTKVVKIEILHRIMGGR